MKYYIVSDIHGFYTELTEALTERGFFDDIYENKLIICGDLFDRGKEACKIQDFILDLMRRDKVILIKGNHEDLIEELVYTIESGIAINQVGSYHWNNGTIDTAIQLSKMSFDEILINPRLFVYRMKQTPYMSQIIPSMINYFETSEYVFTHGWLPFTYTANGKVKYRVTLKADELGWKNARWTNGINMASKGCILQNKTVVCGHIFCGFGRFDGVDEIDYNDYLPYKDKGIIAIDSCVAITHKINCIVIDD